MAAVRAAERAGLQLLDRCVGPWRRVPAGDAAFPKPTRPGESRFVFSDKEARTLQADAARRITVRVFGQGGENDS